MDKETYVKMKDDMRSIESSLHIALQRINRIEEGIDNEYVSELEELLKSTQS